MAIEYRESEEEKSDGSGRAGCLIFGVLGFVFLVLPFSGYIVAAFWFGCGDWSFG